jgi:pimeloyl-ACP methyl ester carboxylesterase
MLPRGIAWPLRAAGSATLGGLASRSLAFTTARDLLHQGPVFDTFLADRALASLEIVRPGPQSWLDAAVRSAEERGWQAPPVDEWGMPVSDAALPAAAAEMALSRNDPVLREKRFHQVGDVNVAYRDIGEGEPVVFLHGMAGAHAWDGVVQRLAIGRRTLIVETLGLSDTEGPTSADFGLAAQAARVRGLLSALDIPAAHIVGNDAGGVIAQIFAVRWPNCVKSLVLSDCDAHGTWPSGPLSWAARWMALPGGPAALAALLRIPAMAGSRAGFGRMVYDQRLLTGERLKRYVDMVAGNRSRRMRLKRFVRSLDQTDVASLNQLLGELDAPTLVVWGAENDYSSASWAKTLYDAIPGARRLELIPFAGISCHEERPDLFAQLLTQFFDECYQGIGTKAPTSRT